MSIIVLGTVALDTVRTPFGFKRHMLGGSAVHFAMAARLFSKVSLVAIVGRDFPQKYLDFLAKKRIILTSLIRSEGKTFKWKGEYKGNLDIATTLNTQLGVLSCFKPVVSSEQKRIKYIFLANVDPDMQRHLLRHMYSPRLIGLDSMNYWIRHNRKALIRLLKEVNIYVANEQEARDLSGESNLLKAAKRLHCLGPQMVLIKKGEHGVLFYSDRFIFSIPAYPSERVIDPTGAGDTFAGGFMGYLAKTGKINHKALKKAIAYGTVAASFNIEGFGVNKTAKLSLRGLENRLSKFKECVLF